MITWKIEQNPVPYDAALAFMESHVAKIIAGQAGDMIWLLEHPPLYTRGTSAAEGELLDPRFPVFDAGRGGRFTYHGPGQRIAYAMIDLRNHGRDVRAYVMHLENWARRALAAFGVDAQAREGRVGLWVTNGMKEEKIAAIGVRIRKWVAFHGIAVNRDPDLSHFNGIVPCGLSDYGVTSLAKLGVAASAADLDKALQASWQDVRTSAP